jgi:hypothetical protein
MADELVQAALAGGSRTGSQPAGAEDPTEALAGGMGVLLRAGLRDVYRRAGYVPPTAPEPFPPVPDEPETICPLSVEPALREMMARSSPPSAQSEAFRALARRGWVLPPGALVLVLSDRLEVRELPDVLGARGRWLASLNDDWRWVIDGDRPLEASEAERVWMEGTKAERVGLIPWLRARDAAAARERVAAAFAVEPADLRQQFVWALEINLSAADEPFLEAALDDRSKGVRGAAASLLARLSESAYVARMVARARPLVARRPLRREVTLLPAPEPPDDWRRDGIGAAGSEEGIARTIQVLSSMPAAVLTRELNLSPEDVLAAADRYDATPLIDAWARNAHSTERDALLPLLWDRWWTKPLKRTSGNDAVTLLKLTRTMPPDMLRQRVLRLLDDPPAGTERLIVLVLREMDVPWPDDVSRAVLDLLRRWLERTLRKDRNAGDWLQIVLPLASHASPGTLGEALELLAALERTKVVPAWNHEVRQAREQAHVRQRFWYAMAEATIQGELGRA